MTYSWTDLKTWNSPAMKRIIESINAIGRQVSTLSGGSGGGDGANITNGDASVSVGSDGSIMIQPSTGENPIFVGVDGSIAMPFDANAGFDAYDFGASYCEFRMLAGLTILQGGNGGYSRIRINEDKSIDLSVQDVSHITVAPDGAVTISSASGNVLYMSADGSIVLSTNDGALTLSSDTSTIVLGADGVITLSTPSGAGVTIGETAYLTLSGGGATDLHFETDGSVSVRSHAVPMLTIGENGELSIPGLPTVNPAVLGQIWEDASAGHVLKVSQG